MLMIDNGTFCMAPFKNAVIDKDGSMLPCCEYMSPSKSATITDINRWWIQDLNALRTSMIDGIPNEGCRHCLSKENNPGYQSHRFAQNNQHARDIESTIANYTTGQVDNISTIEIRVSNYCNLSCIMCGGYASSSIAHEYRTHKDKYDAIGLTMFDLDTVAWWEKEENLKNLQQVLENVKTISFSGGEPLIVPQVIDILNFLDPIQIKSITFYTNLTKLSDRMLTAFKRFKKIKLGVSLEGVGNHNDYIRHGSKWSIIENNINIVKQYSNIEIMPTHVLQHTSLFSLPGLIDFCQSNRFSLGLHEIYYNSYPGPGVLTINSADPADVDKFKTWLNTYHGRYKNLLTNWVNSYKFDSTLNEKFHEYIDMLDGIRGKDFQTTFKNIS
jgi:radical SAM protein with 4Fe4S-binding SPASM domain